MQEIWKDVVGYEGHYKVSNMGNVASLKRGFNLLSKCNSCGYLVCRLTIDGKGRNFKVHRLVAIAFIENPERLPHINHIDCNKKNNSVENLEWCTPLQNNRHAINNGLVPDKDVENSKNVKLKKKDVLEILRLLESGKKQKDIAEIYGVSKKTISHINTGRKWGSVTGKALTTRARTV